MSRLSHILFSAIMLIIAALPAHAQFSEPVYSAPSPDVATLGTFGQVPVGLFTGTPDISVPIYEVTAGDLSFPITLSYHLASVKPNLPPGNYGLGWSLSTDACISRTVRGVPDEKMDSQGVAHGFYGHCSKMQDISTDDFAYMTATGLQSSAQQNNWYELSADEFAFSFNGYSGNFYINPDGGWTVVSDQDIKVEFNPLSGGFLSLNDLSSRIPGIANWSNRQNCTRWFGSFTLITPDGTRYTFGGADATDFSIDYYARSSSDLIATAWHLKQITTPQGRQINFTYAVEDRPLMIDIRYVSGRRTTLETESSNPQYLYSDIRGRQAYTGFLLFPARLESVTSPNEIVEFTYSLDFRYGPRFLQTPDVLYWEDHDQQPIRIFSNPVDPRTQFFELIPAVCQVGYPQLNRRAISEALRHDWLHRIAIYPSSHTEYGRTIYFEYEGTTRQRLSALLWREGTPSLEYHNIAFGNTIYPILKTPEDTSRTSLPRWHFHYDESHAMPSNTVFPATDAWGYWNGGMKSPSQVYYDSENPSPASIMFTKAETLRGITFPTGGSARFEFEGHSYSKIVPADHGTPSDTSANAGGLRIKALILTDRNGKIVSEKQYYYTDSIGSSISSGVSSGNNSHRLEYVISGGNSRLRIDSESGFSSSTTGLNTPDVGYSAVIEETRDCTGTPLGFIRYRFTNFDSDIFGHNHPDRPAWFAYNISGAHPHVPYTSNSAERGHLLSKEYFGRDTLLERKEIWHYDRVRMDSLATATQEVVTFSSDPTYYVSANIGWLTRTQLYSYLPSMESVFDYTPSGTFASSKSLLYNDSRLLIRDSTSLSDGSPLVHHYTYPADYPQYSWMSNRNIISSPVSVRTATPEGIMYKTAEYSSVQGSFGNPVPYVSRLTSGKEGSTLIKTDFQVLQAGSWGNPEKILVDGLHTEIVWTASGQLPARIRSCRPEVSALPPDYSGIPLPPDGSSLFLFPEPDEAQNRCYLYNPDMTLLMATEPNGLATCYGYDALGRLNLISERDITDSWSENRTNRRHRYVYQLSEGVSLPAIHYAGNVVPSVSSNGGSGSLPTEEIEPYTASLTSDGASELYLNKGKAYETHLEYRFAEYHVDSLTNICHLTMTDTIQARFDIRNFRYYRSTPVLDSLPPGNHTLNLKLYHTPPNGNDSLVVHFPFQIDGRTMEVSVNETMWPESDSVIVNLLPGWYRIDFNGINLNNIYEPVLRGRSVVMMDYPSFDFRVECLPLDSDDPAQDPEPQPEPVSSWNRLFTLSSRNGSDTNGQVSIDWYDDFGRKEITQEVRASPSSGKDLIYLTETDALDRTTREWLATPVSTMILYPWNQTSDPIVNNRYEYFPPDSLRKQFSAFYGNTERPFTEYGYESSLNRPAEVYGPGGKWHTDGKAVRTEYLTNSNTNVSLKCRRVTCSPNNLSIWTVASSGFYADGTLHVTKVTDEDGRISLSFEDSDGNLVLSRKILSDNGTTRFLDTYYAYDTFGHLLAVLPPLASAALQKGSVSSTTINQYAYLYKYDDLGRTILKKLPGAEPVYYVYDNAGRVVLTQDGNSRTKGQAVFSLYDVFGRECVRGTCTNAVAIGNHVDTLVRAQYTGVGPLGGYTVQGVTLNNPQLLKVNWYDNYAFVNDVLGQPAAAADTLYFGTPATRTDALLTGTWSAVLDGTGTVQDNAVWSIIRYNRRNRVAKTVSSDHIGGWTTEDVQYTFQGSPSAKHIVHHEASGRTRTEEYAYTYDDQERLLSISHSIDGGSPVILASNLYDDLGRIASTLNAGKTDLQQSYSYNIRSQVTAITGPLFSERLYYEQAPAASPSATINYGGNISSMEWKVGDMSAFAGWNFTYDGLGRLSESNYRFGSYPSGEYDTAYTYDDHGNIRTIRENGLPFPDRLYSYAGNHLQHAFYDANGNLTKDTNHGLGSVQYNIINLPALIQKTTGVDTVRYAYTADGTKLCETVSRNGILVARKDYAANRVYRNGNLRYILTDKGYLEYPDSVAGQPTVPERIFLLRDHLGSVRIVADTLGSVRQANHYYPYGGLLDIDYIPAVLPDLDPVLDPEPDPGWIPEPGPISDSLEVIEDPIVPVPSDSSNNPYKFIGKEVAGGSGLVIYDFGARFYSPYIPRWLTMDPFAEKNYDVSPYVYCVNDPINILDTNGKEPIKKAAGTVSGFVGFMNNIPTGIGTSTGIKAHSAMLRMGMIKGIKPKNTAPFNASGNNRYIYTIKGGWIDMAHFMFYAGRAYQYKQQKLQAQSFISSGYFALLPKEQQRMIIAKACINPVNEAVQDGYLQEFSDMITAPHSAYSYEDLPSDLFGAEFAVFYFDPDSEKTFSEQIQDFLNNVLEATLPQNAPNYEDLPNDYPDKPSKINKTTTPAYVQ